MPTPPPDDVRTLARQAVLEEVAFRMDKLWRLFSWTSAVLTAMIGGTIALRTGEHDLLMRLRGILAGAAIVLALYGVLWLRQNLRLERQARDALAAHDEALGIADYNASIRGALRRPDVGVVVGYPLTVLLLALAAVAAALIPLG
ncbi:MAG: hypothetical protein R3181_15855 [Rubricoccaceae bacterium]|nr:hypothetical protein [Rubricoccaceae bacterium]